MTDNEFEQLLNEINDEVTVFGQTFEAGTLIRKMDPVAFEVMKSEYEQQNH